MPNTKTVVLTVLTVFLVLNGISQFFAGLPTWDYSEYEECGVDGYVCDPTNWVQIYVGLISLALAVGTGLLASTEHEDIVTADLEASRRDRDAYHQQELERSKAEREADTVRYQAIFIEDEYQRLKREEEEREAAYDEEAAEREAQDAQDREDELASDKAKQALREKLTGGSNTGEEQV